MNDLQILQSLADLQTQQFELAKLLKETVLLTKRINQNLGELAQLVATMAETQGQRND